MPLVWMVVILIPRKCALSECNGAWCQCKIHEDLTGAGQGLRAV